MAANTVAVLINVIEARDLKPRSSSGMCDPVLIVETLGEQLHTPTVKKDLSPYWNHYFHIEEKCKNFQRETLDVTVYDTATTFRKELIGSFEFELSDIYAQKNHEYFNVWVILSNHTLPGKPGVQGYLKLSVTVLKPGDTPVQHTEEGVEDSDVQEDNLANMVLLKPAGLDAVEHTLKTKVFKAENLPKMDTLGVCDPFVEIKYANNTNRSRVEKNTAAPVWNEEVNLPVTMPSMADTITMSLYDHDVGKSPELISQSFLSCKSVQEKAQAGLNAPSWVNFYRGKGQGNEPLEYCGRVLSSIAISIGEGKAAVIPIPSEPEPPTTSYTLQLDVYECQGVDAPLYPIYVTASVGPYSCKTHPVKIKNKSAEYYASVPDLDFSFPSDISQVPDLFIYVYEDVPGSDKRHGYLRYSHAQLESLQSNPRWEVLKRVSSQSKDNEHPPGFLHFRVSFGPSAVLKQKTRAKITRPAKKLFQLRAHLYVARDLPAGDEDALSDPYCLVNISHAKGKSKIREHTIFPDWFESVVLDVELPEQLNLAPDIYLSVYDHDMLTPDEFLGCVVVNLATSDVSTSKNINAPKWFPLVLGDKVKGKGSVLASFQLLPSDIAQSILLPDLHPKLLDCEIDIGVIGLRNLAPFQLLPVSNAYLKFTCPGTKPLTTKPSKIPVPKSPNFFENIVLPVALPEVLDFIPALLVEVYDPRPGKDAKIAATSIPLSAFVPWGANSSAKLPFGVRLPPSVDESSFYQPSAPLVPTPQLSSVSTPFSSSIDIKLDNLDHTTVEVAAPDIADNELSTLLPKGDKGKSVQSIAAKREVPTTIIPGQEEVPDNEPIRQEFAAEVEHQMQSFPFLEVDLYRGTSAGISSGSIFNKKEAIVGRFKGSISVRALSSSSKKHDNRAKLDVTKLNIPRPYVVRVYIEQGQNLVPKDANGSSDPYLVLYNSNPSGKNKGNIIKDVENVKPHTLQPDFYKMYELKGLLPDDNELVVQVWDKDDIGSDEFIGETRYDLEMLWFSDEWRKMQLKPKENRTLWNPLSAFPQGKLKMWVELLTLAEAGSTPPSPIGPPIREAFELRIVVWETRNVVPKDKILGKESSDQFVGTKLLNYPQPAQQTDVHDSVMDGCGKFNWRIVYPDVFLPYDTPRLKLQVYDKDKIGPNDAIAEANLNLKGFFQKALRQKSARIGALAGPSNTAASAVLSLGTDSKGGAQSAGPYNTGQWLDLYHPSYDGPQGSICLEVELLSREEAAAKRAGNGRSEPNQNPFLPAPVRPSRKWFSDLFSFLGLDKIKKYLIIAGVVVVIIIVIILIVNFS